MLKLTKAKDLDLSDPRVRRTALKGLEFLGDLSTWREPKMIAASTLRKELGNTSRGIGKVLAACLWRHGAYDPVHGKSFRYSVDPEAFERLEAKLGTKWDIVSWAAAKGWTFTTAPPPRDKQPRTGDRVYSWWVTMNKARRLELFARELGGGFDYDIEAAKPTLILQAFDKHMAEQHTSVAYDLSTWRAYVADRSAVRQRLMDDLGLSKEQAKQVCQDVLNSAVAAVHPKNGIFQRLGEAKTRVLLEHPIYQGLASDFSYYWQHVKELNDLKLSAGEFTSAWYNKLEWEVMNVVEAELNQPGWFVHDGFMTARAVDSSAICAAVKARTGYDIKLSETPI